MASEDGEYYPLNLSVIALTSFGARTDAAFTDRLVAIAESFWSNRLAVATESEVVVYSNSAGQQNAARGDAWEDRKNKFSDTRKARILEVKDGSSNPLPRISLEEAAGPIQRWRPPNPSIAGLAVARGASCAVAVATSDGHLFLWPHVSHVGRHEPLRPTTSPAVPSGSNPALAWSEPVHGAGGIGGGSSSSSFLRLLVATAGAPNQEGGQVTLIDGRSGNVVERKEMSCAVTAIAGVESVSFVCLFACLFGVIILL